MRRFLVWGAVVFFTACVGDSTVPDGGADATADNATFDAPADVDAAPAPTVVAVYAGGAYQGATSPTLDNGDRSCAIIAPAGAVWCWGDNQLGQLGIGTTGNDSIAPVQITKDTSNAAFANVAELALGGWHTCARKNDGKVFCWGQDQSGAIGDNTVDPNGTRAPVPSPQPLALGTFVAMQNGTALGAGYGHTCAIDSTGKASCFGWNGDDQLGHASTSDPACSWMYIAGTKCNGTPTAVMDNAPFTNANIAQVAMGETFSCARTTGGNVFCFGDRSWFGTPAGTNPAPFELMTDSGFTQPLTNATSIVVAAKTLCVLTTAQTVYCAGFNAFGQAGFSGSSVGYAQLIANFSGAKAIAGGDSHVCALKGDGSVWCWGINNYGQLGNGISDAGMNSNPTPTQVSGLSNVASLAGGFGHTCALKTDGTVWCWGRNNHGQLGDGTVTDRATPVQVKGLP